MSGSFFGPGIGLPDDAIARERTSFHRQNHNVDLDARLETLALGDDGLGEALEDDQDDFNDETFDADLREITGKDFDFYQSTVSSHAGAPQQQQQQYQQQQYQQQQYQQQAQRQTQPALNDAQSGNKVMTLAELEARMLMQQQQQRQQQHIQQQPSMPPMDFGRKLADPEVVARRKRDRLQRQMELSKYDNMMSRHDKDYIVRIQISQLLTDDPAADDFYCHMYQLSRGTMFGSGSLPQQTAIQNNGSQDAPTSRPSAETPASGNPGQQPMVEQQGKSEQSPAVAGRSLNSHGSSSSNDARRSNSSLGMPGQSQNHPHQHLGRSHRSNTQSSMARMQQQVQRIVNEAKRRPKAAHVAAEGALGRISVNSARNPKQVIQVQQRGHAGSISQSDAPRNSPLPATHHDLGGIFSGMGDTRNPASERRKTLRSIENVYTAVLRLEQLIREQVRLPQNPDHPSVQQWLAMYSEAKERAWSELDASQPISNTYPHPLVRFLSFSKGKRIIPRLVHHLSIDQILALTTTIIANFETLDVCRFGSFSYSASGSLVAMQQREETDLFLHAVMPPTLAFLAETSLQIVNGLFALFMERNNIAWVARTRPALAFLTVLLGRSATLRQAGAHAYGAQPDAQEVYQSSELYNHLFNSLRGNLVSIFPPSSTTTSSPAMGQAISPISAVSTVSPMEDLHAWQFLATLAIGASVEQQHALVSEVREKVLEKVMLAKSGHVPIDIAMALTANVNLFLNALGLDASQVAT